jgi:hypothetical protein
MLILKIRYKLKNEFYLNSFFFKEKMIEKMIEKIYKIYINYLLKDINNVEDVYKLCLKNSKICMNNKQIICKKILILSGYKKFLTKDYFLICKELSNIVKKYISIKDVNKYSCISMTEVLWNACKIYGSSELNQFIDINRTNDMLGYDYEKILNQSYISSTFNEDDVRQQGTLCSGSVLYSNIVVYSDIVV